MKSSGWQRRIKKMKMLNMPTLCQPCANFKVICKRKIIVVEQLKGEILNICLKGDDY